MRYLLTFFTLAILKAVSSQSNRSIINLKKVQSVTIHHEQRERKLEPASPSCQISSGTCTVLAIRVTAPDASVTSSLSELNDYIFGSGFSMKSQFAACSLNSLNMVPFSGLAGSISLANGMTEINIDINAINEQAGLIATEVLSAAAELYGDLESQFNFVMLCLPPGTLIGTASDWKGYAYVESYISVFNDVNCNYPSVQMHEIGHNMGLSHSNDEVNYGDEFGMMGISYSSTTGPHKCFNGPKSWKLGWYNDTQLVYDVRMGMDIEVKLIGIGDSSLNDGQYKTIVKIINSEDGYDYYLTFNHKTNMIVDAKEARDQVLVTRQSTGTLYQDSFLVGKIGDAKSYVISQLSAPNAGTLFLYVDIFLASVVSHAVVRIQRSNLACVAGDDETCDDFNSCTSETCPTGSCIFNLLPCSGCGAPINLNLTTNNAPELFAWSIEEIDSKYIVFSSGYYSEPNKLYHSDRCLQYGRYRFVFTYDAPSESAGDFDYTLYTFSSSTIELIDTLGVEDTKNGIYFETIFSICETDYDCEDLNGCTVDTCNSDTRLCEYTVIENCLDCEWMTLDFKLDNFPEETTWGIYDYKQNSFVLSGDPYPNYVQRSGRRSKPTRAGRRKAPTRAASKEEIGRKNTRYSSTRLLQEEELFQESYCLQREIQFLFIIRDSFGDGICCSQGNGFYSLISNNEFLVNGGQFGDEERALFMFKSCSSDAECDDNDFCTVDTCRGDIFTCYYTFKECIDCGAYVEIELITPELLPFQSKWEVLQSSNVIFSGGPYAEAGKLVISSKCLSFGSYVVNILTGNHITAGGGSGSSFKFSISNELIAQGTTNDLRDKNFVICASDADCGAGDTCIASKNVCQQSVIIPVVDYPSSSPYNHNSTAPPSKLLLQSPSAVSPSLVPSVIVSEIPSNIPSLLEISSSPSSNPSAKPSKIFSQPPSTDGYKSPSLVPSVSVSDNPSNMPSNLEISPSSSSPSYMTSQSPSITNENNSSQIPADEYFIQFDEMIRSSNSTNILDGFSLKYRLALSTTVGSFISTVFDKSCREEVTEEVVQITKVEVDSYGTPAYDFGIVSIHVNETLINNSTLWGNVTNTSGVLNFCVKSELLLEPESNISVSFSKVNVILDIDLLASTSNFEIADIGLLESANSKVVENAEFEVHGCVCSNVLECISNPILSQNTKFKICMSTTEGLTISSLMNVIFYQDGMAKFIAVEDNKANTLTTFELGETISFLETRLISSFFDEPDPLPITIKGDVILGFKDRRLSDIGASTGKSAEKLRTFETTVMLKKKRAIFPITYTLAVIVVALFFFSLGKRNATQPYLIVSVEEK